VPSGQQREQNHDGSRPGGERPLRRARAAEAPERVDQQPVPALEDDRRKRDSDGQLRAVATIGVYGWGITVVHLLPEERR